MPHVAEKMMAAIPSDKRLPGGVFKFDGNNTTGGYFESGSNTGLGLCPQAPNLGQKSWFFACYCLATGGAVNDYIFSIRNTNNDYMSLHRNSSSQFDFRFVTGGVTRISLQVTAYAYGVCQLVCVWRNGSEWGLGVYNGNGVTSTPDLVEATPGTLAPGGTGDTYNTSIRAVEATRVRIGHFDGATATYRFAGSVAALTWAIAPSGDLSSYNLSTKAQRKRCLRDLQYLFHTAGFAPSDVMSYGNWADSSGVLKTSNRIVQIETNDRIVCPFTGQYLTYAITGNANQVTGPPYTLPSASLQRPHRGNWSYLADPVFELRPGGGALVARHQINAQFNSQIMVDRIEADGEVHSWPIQFMHRYPSIDSSASNARVDYYMSFPSNPTHMGDTHSDCSLKITNAGIVVSPVFHSDIQADKPDTGDHIIVGDGQWIVLRDADEDPLVLDVHPTNPWGTSWAASTQDYTDLSRSYTLLSDQGTRLVEMSRSRASGAAKIVMSDLTYSNVTVRSKICISDATGARLYPGPLVYMPDGYTLCTGYLTLETPSPNNTIMYWGMMMPPAADWADNTKWHAFDGTALDGASGRPTLGTVTLGDTPAFHMLNQDINAVNNQDFFPTNTFPSNGTGMHTHRMEQPCLITGEFVGIAAIVRTSSTNAPVTSSTGTRCNNATSGSWNIPWDTTELWRWEYNSTTKGFTFYDKTDITSIIDTLNPGAWPGNGSYNTSDVQYLQAMQVGPNRMLLLIADPESVDPPANTSFFVQLLGYTLRGALFYDLDGDSPEDYIDLLDDLATLATDGSEGYGFMVHNAAGPNGHAKVIGLKVTTGDYHASLPWGCYVPKTVDLVLPLRDALSANHLLPAPRYSGNLQGWI